MLRSVNSRSMGGNEVYYSDDSLPPIRHPWSTQVEYDAASASWVAYVKPGFVNGLDPRLPDVESKAKKATGQDVVVSLCDEEPTGLYGWSDVERPSKFFQEMGVVSAREALKIDTNTGTVQMQISSTASGLPPRILKQCQIYIQQPRITYKVVASAPANLVTGDIADYNVTYDTTTLDLYGTRARLMTGSVPGKVAPSLADRLSGAYGDDGMDYLLVADVFAVSPIDADGPALQNVNSQWEIHVQHKLFWNVNHAMRNLPPVNLPRSMVDPFLAFFVGRYSFAPVATFGALQSEMQRITAAVFNSTAGEGRFWTA